MYGVHSLSWSANIPEYFILLISGLLTQFFWIKYHNLRFDSFKSGLITSLGLCLLLKSSFIVVYLLAPFLAISSKYLIRVRGKHLFNPANFGLLIPFLLGVGSVAPGQWGNEMIFLFLTGVMGWFVLMKVNRLDSTLSFLITLWILSMAYQCIYKGWSWDYIMHDFSSGSLLIFAFFMITDPMTSPNSRKARIAWAAFITIETYVLKNVFYQNSGAAIVSLGALSLFTPLLDNLIVSKAFVWK